MNRFYKIILSAAVVCSLSRRAYSVSPEAGTSGAAFLRIPAGARPVAMGESFTAVSDDVNAVWWNPAGLAPHGTPAGLAGQKKRAAGFVHNEWLEGMRQEYLSYVHPIGRLGLGGGVNILRATLNRTEMAFTSQGVPYPVKNGEFSAYDMAVTLAAGYKTNDEISVGAALKFVYQKNEEVSGMTAVFDVGALYRKDLFSGGLNIQNLGPGISMDGGSFSMPVVIKAGAAYFLNEKTTLAMDINKPLDNLLSINAGGEFKALDLLSLRAGYKFVIGNPHGYLSGFRAGFGVNYREFGLDYALLPWGDLGFTHTISFSCRF